MISSGRKHIHHHQDWHTLASGSFTVDDATRAQAKKDISEDGYWGVKQTSQRLLWKRDLNRQQKPGEENFRVYAAKP